MSKRRMKPYFLSLIVFLLFLSDVQAQSYKQRDQFVGRVKAIRLELVYLDTEAARAAQERHLSALRTFDTSGRLTSYEDFYAYGAISYGRDTYSYDSAGNVIEKAHEINGSVYKTTYSYDTKGRMITQSGGGHLREYRYDADGRLTEVKRSYNDGTDDGKELMSYDPGGLLTGRKTYDRNGSLEAQETKAYNAEGHLVREVAPFGTKSYDATGRLLSEITGKHSSDRYYRKVVYKYDGNGRVAGEDIYDGKGLKETFVYTYEYDSVGNWTKQVTVNTVIEGRTRVWETYRIITYY